MTYLNKWGLMNLVLSRLTLTSCFSPCSTFCGACRIEMFDNYVKRSYSGFFHGEGCVIVIRSAFNTFLHHPLAFISCSSRIESTNTSINVKNSKFCSCSSIYPGGAIFASHLNSVVNIEDCLFDSCYATGSYSVSFIDVGVNAGGGGCALLCSRFSVTLCCFTKCFSIERGPALFTASSGYDDAILNYSVVVGSFGGEIPIHFAKGREIMSNVNTTLNSCLYVSAAAFTFGGIQNLLQYSNIAHCLSTHSNLWETSRVFDFSISTSQGISRMCNFINNSNINSVKCIIFSYQNLITIDSFVFCSNDSPIFNKLSGTINVINSIFDNNQIGNANLLSNNTLLADICFPNQLNMRDNCFHYYTTIQIRRTYDEKCELLMKSANFFANFETKMLPIFISLIFFS